MNPYLLIAAYCVPIVASCLLGGWIPRAFRLTHTRMQTAISFVAGIILGVGVLHLLPHGYEALGDDLDGIVHWMLGGFLVMFFVERFLHFHHHDAPDESPSKPHEHDHGHDHPHAPHETTGDSQEHVCDQHEHHASAFGLHVHSSTWIATAFGMTLHSLIDGAALAGAVLAESTGDHGTRILAGFGVFLAVLLHKPFDSLTISMLMSTARCSARQRRWINGAYSVMVPIGAAIILLASRGADDSTYLMGAILGLAAGAFLCIATSDLLPELQFHTHDRFKLSAALMLGVALAWGIIFFETTGHGQHREQGEEPSSAPASSVKSTDEVGP